MDGLTHVGCRAAPGTSPPRTPRTRGVSSLWCLQTAASPLTHAFRCRPDGEQHWTKEIEDAKRRMDELGIEWRTGLADYHGPNGGPEGWRRHRESEQEAWERMRKGA